MVGKVMILLVVINCCYADSLAQVARSKIGLNHVVFAICMYDCMHCMLYAFLAIRLCFITFSFIAIVLAT